jgi:hypothetical protein
MRNEEGRNEEGRNEEWRNEEWGMCNEEKNIEIPLVGEESLINFLN